jgi:hypothetical protein
MQNGQELWISHIYFTMENLMDRVHDVWTRQHGSAPPWTEVARTKGRGSALAACGAWVLVLAGARGVLTGARAVVKMRRDGGEEWRWLELSVRAKEGAGQLGRERKKGR